MHDYQITARFEQAEHHIESLSNIAVNSTDALKTQSESIVNLSKAIIALSNRISQLENQIQDLKYNIPS